MALHFDENVQEEKKEFELVAEGEYEATLTAEWSQTRQSKEPYINIVFKIRKDVDQKFGGRLVFDPLYKTKSTGDFQQSKIKALLNAIPNAKRDFEDYDELIQYLNDKDMIIYVEIDKAETADKKDRNVVKYLSYKESKQKRNIVLQSFDDNDDIPF